MGVHLVDEDQRDERRKDLIGEARDVLYEAKKNKNRIRRESAGVTSRM